MMFGGRRARGENLLFTNSLVFEITEFLLLFKSPLTSVGRNTTLLA